MRLTVAMAMACLSIAGVSANEPAFASIRKHTNIPAQSLESALQTLARERDFQVLYLTEVVGSRETNGASGALTVDQALETLLAGTGLTYQMIDENTVSIVPMASAPPPTPPKTEAVERQTQIEEILVTAQKREERLIDVPISIVALGADELQKRRVTSLDDLGLIVPGLAVQSANGGLRRIMLRGISNIQGASSLIGLYLDEASVATTPARQLDLRTYDLERVEVLRGPQGTLYGEGSVGGTIRFITKNPVLNDFAMKADVAALFTESGAPGQRVQTALNIPLVEDELGVRIAGTFEHGGGWIDQPAIGATDVNDQDTTHVRVKGLWRPTPQLSVNAMAVVHRAEGMPSYGENENGDFVQVFSLPVTPSGQDDYNLYNLTLTYDLPAVRVLSSTSYVDQDKQMQNLGQRGQYTPPPSTKFDVLFAVNGGRSTVLTEELRLSSLGTSALNWTAGAFFRDSDTLETSTLRFGLPVLPGSPLPAPSRSSNRNTSQSWAVFGEVSYALTRQFTAGAGLRYFEDDRDLISGFAPVQTRQQGRFDALTPRAFVQYKLTDHATIYASAAEGFRSGGFNQLNRPKFKPESVWTYELGTKLQFRESGLSVDAAAYYSDYAGYQIVGFRLVDGLPVNLTSNAGNAKIEGVEMSLGWRPTDRWAFNLNGNYLTSEFYEIDALSSSHAVGDRLDLFPKYSYTASAQRDFQLSRRAGFARLDYSEQGPAPFINRSVGPWYFVESDVIHMLNAHAGLQWSDSLTLGVFAQNLLNDRHYTDSLSLDEAAARSRPRTYGIEFAVSFE